MKDVENKFFLKRLIRKKFFMNFVALQNIVIVMKKCFVFFSIFILSYFSSVYSQEKKLRKAMKDLTSNEFKDSREKIYNYIIENPNSAMGYFCLHLWFLKDSNPSYNPDSAYINLLTSIKSKYLLTEKEMQRACEDFSFCETKLVEYQEINAYKALSLIKQKEDLTKVPDFLNLYQGLNTTRQAISYRDSTRLEKAIAQNNSSVLKTYIEQNPESTFMSRAKEKLVFISFEEAKKENTEIAYDAFIKEFPGSIFENEANLRAIDASYFEAKKSYNEDLFLKHIKKYPYSTYLDSCKLFATRIGYQSAKKENTEDAFSLFQKKYPSSVFADSAKYWMETLAYQGCLKKNTEEAYENFLEKYPRSTKQQDVKIKMENCAFENAAKIDQEDKYYSFLKKYPMSLFKDSVLILAEISAFKKSSKNKNENECRVFLKNYPNSKFASEVKKIIAALDEERISKNINDDSFEELSNEDLFLYYKKDADIFYFFKNDTAMLMDQIIGFKQKGFNPDAYFDNNYLCPNIYDSNGEDNKISFNGVYIYDKTRSEFGCRCPDNSYNYDTKTSGDGSFCMLMDDKGNNLNPIPLKAIESTPLSYILKIQDSKGKWNLYNALSKKTIAAWVNSIQYVFLDRNYFPKNSLSFSITSQSPVFIGFQTQNYYGKENKKELLNSKGQELINSKKFNDFLSSSGNVINYVFCQHGNQFSSTFFRYYGPTNKYGITNITGQEDVLPAEYDQIGEIDFCNNIVLQKYGSDKKYHALIFNVKKKSFFPFLNPVSEIERVFVPYFSSYANEFNLGLNQTLMNQYFEGENNPCMDFDYYDEESVVPPRAKDILYIGKSNYSDKSNKAWSLYNQQGKLLITGKWNSKVIMVLDSIVHVNLHEEKDVIIDLKGNYLWNPGKNYQVSFINRDLFIYGLQRDGQNFLGLYSLKRGKISEPIYENLNFTQEGVYGIKLGHKTLLLEGNYSLF